MHADDRTHTAELAVIAIAIPAMLASQPLTHANALLVRCLDALHVLAHAFVTPARALRRLRRLPALIAAPFLRLSALTLLLATLLGLPVGALLTLLRGTLRTLTLLFCTL